MAEKEPLFRSVLVPNRARSQYYIVQTHWVDPSCDDLHNVHSRVRGIFESKEDAIEVLQAARGAVTIEREEAEQQVQEFPYAVTPGPIKDSDEELSGFGYRLRDKHGCVRTMWLRKVFVTHTKSDPFWHDGVQSPIQSDVDEEEGDDDDDVKKEAKKESGERVSKERTADTSRRAEGQQNFKKEPQSGNAATVERQPRPAKQTPKAPADQAKRPDALKLLVEEGARFDERERQRKEMERH